jgi:penicillin-binding protein 1B
MADRPNLTLPGRARAARIPWRRLVGLAFGAATLLGAAVIGEALLRARLDPPAARAPSRLYARPLVLEPGATVGRDALRGYLDRLGYQSVRRGRVDPGEYRLNDDEWTIGRRPFVGPDGYDPGGVVVVRLDWGGAVRRLSDGDGHRLERVMLEPEPIGTPVDGAADDRIPVRLADVPDALIQAVLAVEDQRFFSHGGIDFRRVVGAALANLRAHRVVEGGSTITQQLARNLYLSARRSPLRKLREAAIAMALEARYDKPRILEAYLNEIYLGQDGGLEIRGVGRAAQYYFGRNVADVNVAEAALLAGMIRGPNLYTPLRNAGAARERRDLVLRLMREQGRIGGRAAEDAMRAPLRAAPHARPAPTGRYFQDYALDEMRDAGLGVAGGRGYMVFTTLDASLQRAAERAVRDGLAATERGALRSRRRQPLQAALVAIDPRTGDVLAMVGGRDYGASQFNRATQAHRQPGSAFKPIVALTALARSTTPDGPAFTLASVVEDEPLAVQTPAGLWEPDNYDNGFRGQVTVREALEQSLNVPFARIGLAVGPERIVATAKALGITSRLHAVPSLALGASEVTPLELTRAYGVLAAGGLRADTRAVLAVADPKGHVATAPAHSATRVFDQAETYLVTSALQGAVERGTGRGLRAQGIWGPLAGKSGTSSDWRDGWFIAYTPSLVVGVWVGYDDAQSIGLTGSRVALPIVARFLRAALGSDESADFPMPDGIQVAEVDPSSGRLAAWGCGGAQEVFLDGTAPTEQCESSWAPGRWLASIDQLRQLRDLDLDDLRGLLDNADVHDVRGLIRDLAHELRREARRLARERGDH